MRELKIVKTRTITIDINVARIISAVAVSSYLVFCAWLWPVKITAGTLAGMGIMLIGLGVFIVLDRIGKAARVFADARLLEAKVGAAEAGYRE